MKRMFSTLTIKGTDSTGEKRSFTGIASTPTPDRVEDVVEPKGAVFKLPIPLLWQHNSSDPIGWITRAKVTSKGIEIDGQVADIPESGRLKERLLEAWQMIKNGLVRGLSIGFRPIESSEIEGSRWGRRYLKWEWLELSAVTIPANQDASILSIKAAFGHQFNPGVAGTSNGERKMKTLQEQLNELKEARANKKARLSELSEAIKQKTFTPEDGVEFDAIVEEIDQLDNDIRVKQAECINSQTAREPQPVVKTAPTVLVRKTDPDDKFEGQSFIRQVIAKAVAHLDGVSPVAVAQRRWAKSNPVLFNVIKTAVEGGGSGTGDWGAELVAADTRFTGDFITYLHGRTVYDRLPLREVPANVQIKGQDGAATGYWVGENAAITASAQSFSAVNLTPLKVAAMAIVSNELLRDSTPAAEMLVRDALVEASSKRIDDTFLSTSEASAAVSPEGILQNIVADSASGTDADALRADVKTLYADFIAAKTASGLYFVMNPALAKSIQLLYNALGQPEFSGITQDGGTLLGDPVITGDNVNSAHLILLNPREIYKIGDMGVQVSISREATIEMSDSPANESQGATTMAGNIVNMFQTESTAIKIVRPINFQRRRTDAYCVGYVDDAAYDNSTST